MCRCKGRIREAIYKLPDGDILKLQGHSTKFIYETEPLPDEAEAIKRLDNAIINGDTVDFDDIDWN